MLPDMDVDPHGPDAELALLREDYGHRWEVYLIPRAPYEPSWVAYDRLRPDVPAVTADNAGEMRDRLALLTPHPRSTAAT